jgi:hypothetical protein
LSRVMRRVERRGEGKGREEIGKEEKEEDRG